MIPKLYLIKSEERDGLIKIGFAGSGDSSVEKDVVYERIKKYAVGISDSSTVYEVSGAPIFERYFHALVSQKRKPIDIKFKLTNRVSHPKEWFELQPNISKIFIEAFSKEHPRNMDELAVSDLPLFLSGALSAICWHAQDMPTPELAGMLAREEFLSDFAEGRIQQAEYKQVQEQQQDPQPAQLEQESTHYSLFPDFGQLIRQDARLKTEMEEMRDMEAARTIIALSAAVMTLFLLITGASVAGCLFAILTTLLYVSWPILQPYGAAALVELSNRLKGLAKKTRHHVSRYDD